MTTIPTHDWEAETCVLGTMLFDQGCLDMGMSRLELDHFHLDRNERTFTLLRELAAKGPVSVDVLFSAASDIDFAPLGGAEHVAGLPLRATTPQAFPRMCDRLNELRARRRLRLVVSQMTDVTTDIGRSTDEMADEIEALAATIRQGGSTRRRGWRSLGEAADDALARIYARQSGDEGIAPPYGLPQLDALTGGLRPGTVVIVAGRPGAGKTAFCLNAGVNAATNGHGVGLFSLEMDDLDLAERILARKADVNLHDLRNERLSPSTLDRLGRKVQDTHHLPLWVDDTAGLTLRRLRGRVQQLVSRQPSTRVVIVDYLGLVSHDGGKNQGRQETVAEISGAMKALAREHGICMVVLAQLNREIERRTDPTPMLSDLRDSGAIEQDADMVIVLDRPTLRDNGDDPTIRNDVMVHVVKHRAGRTAALKMRWDGARQEIIDPTPPIAHHWSQE